MPRRRLLLFAAAACLLLPAAPFVVRWAMTPAPGPTRENFERLYIGMDLVEANAIMGRSADEVTRDVPGALHYWKVDDTGSIFVLISDFDKQVVYGRLWSFGTNGPPGSSLRRDSLVTRIRVWLGL